MANDIRKCTEVDISRSIINFVTGVDMVETQIGKYSRNVGSDKDDLICSGHIIEEHEPGSTILYTFVDKTKLNITPKFKDAFNKTAVQLVNCCDDIEQDEKEEIKESITALNKNRKLIMPFKPGNTDLEVIIECENTTVKKQMGIHMLKWSTDSETGNLICELMCKSKSNFFNRRCTCRLEDYGTTYNIGALKLSTAGSKVKMNKIIEMTASGMVRPFEVIHKNVSIIVDGTYMYMKRGSDVYVIGEWAGSNMQINTKSEDKALTKMKQCLTVLSLHRKYIAPYMLIDSKKLEVLKG
jgi:hypothetical protein